MTYYELCEKVLKEDLYQYISDAHKDAYGFRCRFDYNEFTYAELLAKADRVTEAVLVSIKEDEARHEVAIVEFEATVKRLISTGAGTRETAVRWIREAESSEYGCGDDYLCYTLGLPYGYSLETGVRARSATLHII